MEQRHAIKSVYFEMPWLDIPGTMSNRRLAQGPSHYGPKPELDLMDVWVSRMHVSTHTSMWEGHWRRPSR